MNYKRITTKDHILNTASKLFMELGFQATTTRDIAELAGITQPNLYHYFKTKEDIYISVLEELSAVVKDKLFQIVNKPDETLVEKSQHILEYLQEKHPVNFSIMSHDMTHEISTESHEHLYLIWLDSYLQPLINLFDKNMTKKSPLNSSQLARHYYSTIAPFLQKENRFHKELAPELIVDLFVYGILDREE